MSVHVEHGQIVDADLHEPRANERGHNLIEVFVDTNEEVAVRDVAGGNDEQSCRQAAEKVAVPEVAVLGDRDPVLDICDPGDLRIGSAVLARKIKRVDRVVPSVVQVACEPKRELRVDQELHAAPSGTRRIPAVLAPNSSAASRSSRSKSR